MSASGGWTRRGLGLVLLTAMAVHAVEAPLVTRPPYRAVLADTAQAVDLAGMARTHDFGGAVPLVDPVTGVAHFATLNVWDAAKKMPVVLTSERVPPQGVAGRVFKTGGYTALGYARGDGPVEGRLRTQLNSFPISARRHYVWDLAFRFGGASLASPWVMLPRGQSPATIWQLKSEGLPPSLVMAFDTDPADPQKLALSFDRRLEPSRPANNLGSLGGLSPQSEIQVRIDAYLDERPVFQSGQGFLRISVNGVLVVDVWGPTLQAAAVKPYQWSIGMYLFANETPLPHDRFVFWKIARLLAQD